MKVKPINSQTLGLNLVFKQFLNMHAFILFGLTEGDSFWSSFLKTRSSTRSLIKFVVLFEMPE